MLVASLILFATGTRITAGGGRRCPGKSDLVVGDDPWGYGNSLERATSCPPAGEPPLPSSFAATPARQGGYLHPDSTATAHRYQILRALLVWKADRTKETT
jgi:hypothetical protein